MFKVQEIREIIRLIDQSSISEFVYENNGATLSVKKPVENKVVSVVEEVAAPKVEQPAAQVPAVKQETPAVAKEAPKAEKVEVADDEDVVEIVSPMVGTFYRKPNPESPVYVEVGDVVKEDSIVCIVEAMKLFNEIEAETSGEIVAILVEDGELVEYGQPLFKVKQK